MVAIDGKAEFIREQIGADQQFTEPQPQVMNPVGKDPFVPLERSRLRPARSVVMRLQLAPEFGESRAQYLTSSTLWGPSDSAGR